MSQLRQEDSETIVSMLHRHCTDNGSMSMTSADVPAEDDQSLPPDNAAASSELTSRLSNLSQMKTQFPEDSKCASQTAVPHCPVCGRSLQWVGGNEVLLNKHVDECLNKVAVSELLASDKHTLSGSR